MENLVILFSYSLLLCLLLAIFNFFQKSWWGPIRVQRIMKLQGIGGPTYKFIHGSTIEITEMRKQSMGRPINGLSHDIFPRILPHVHTWKNTYGVNILNWYGSQAQLIITEPELIKEILNNKDGRYPKIDLEGHAKKLLGDGLSSTKGEKWMKLRKIANHAFHAESLKNMIPEMIVITKTMLEKWKKCEGKEIEVFEEFRVITSEIISKTAFGTSYQEGRTIFEMLMKLTLIVSTNAQKIRFPVLSIFFKSPDDKECNKIEQEIQDCITDIIKKRENTKSGEVESSGNDFLGNLLKAYRDDDESKCISMGAVVDECKTFYFAGHETTTSLLTWTIFLLAVHTNWQEKARREVIELFGKSNPNSDGIPRLKTMNMIIEESLRLYPPVPYIKRKVSEEVKLGNLTLPPQMELYISPLALHHDPQIWGEDVHQFKPERFKGGVAKATNNTSAAFLPFGFGPRTCVGMSFAISEAKIVLSMILQRYAFTLSPTYVHSPIQIFMIRPQNGVQVALHTV